MDRRLVLLPLLALAGPLLSGCVAAAIPALAGSALVGKRVIDGDKSAEAPPAVAVAPAAPAAAPVTAPAPIPVVNPTPTPPPAPVVLPPAPVVAQPAPPPVPVPAPAPVASAAVADIAPPTPPQPLTTYPDPANPIPNDQIGFARFVRYTQASAIAARGGANLASAMLSDPVAIDGKRRRCSTGEQQVAVIDIDPRGGLFAPQANPQQQPGLALGLAVLREAGVEIAWLSDISTEQSGALRTALERSGLDPRGEDIISLRRDEGDTKQKRKDNLAGITCIVAIAGDERADFDERFKYLRSPEAGAELEPLIGDGWFLTAPLLGTQGQ
jgi:outer membrane biosynthesis protein TonB